MYCLPGSAIGVPDHAPTPTVGKPRLGFSLWSFRRVSRQRVTHTPNKVHCHGTWRDGRWHDSEPPPQVESECYPVQLMMDMLKMLESIETASRQELLANEASALTPYS